MFENYEELLRRPAVEQRTGLSRSTLYELIARGEFPAPVHLTERAVAWPRTAVDAWIAARIGRDAARRVSL